MCKESNEDDTKRHYRTNKQRALTSLQLVYSCVFTCFRFASTLNMLLCLLFCAFVSSFQSSSMFPYIDFSTVCEFLVIVHTAKTGLLRCCLYKKKQCQKDMAKWVGDREKAKNDIQERNAQIDKCNQKVEKTSGAEAELDEEIRILQAGDEKAKQLCVAVQRMLLRSSRGGAAHHDGSNTGLAPACLYRGKTQQGRRRAASATASHSCARAGGRRRRIRKW